MTLIGVRSANHPQQVARRGASDDVDDRATHPIAFADFERRFGPFTLDVAAAPHNTKCARYFAIEDDGLAQPWSGEHVWCNPPYSDCGAWVAKAWQEASRTRGIVMLLPANRTEQNWWQELVEPYRDRDDSFRVEFLPGRLRFLRPGQDEVAPNERPPFGCCLFLWSGTDGPAPDGSHTKLARWRAPSAQVAGQLGLYDGALS